LKFSKKVWHVTLRSHLVQPTGFIKDN